MTLEHQVNALLNLISQANIVQANIRVDTAAVKRSLHKATSPRFEIVFAGTFSAGKSTLINTLLERKLLYSSPGVATGTVCYVEYAQNPDDEKAVLYFFSKNEIRQQISELCNILGLADSVNLDLPASIQNLREQAEHIKLNGTLSEAKQAELLQQLLTGFEKNKENIQNDPIKAINLEDAENYVRWENAAVFKQIKYYCHNSLLKNGIVIVDTPGIDAPLLIHTKIAFDKITHPDTSAVVCVLQTASRGSLIEAEIKLIEHIRNAPGVSDRIFYVFNHIDATWFDAALHGLLEGVIHADFHQEQQKGRVYKTSAMLGFYGSLRRNDRTFQVPDEFKSEFNRYFFLKVSRVDFPITPAIAAADTDDEKFKAIIDAHGDNLLDKLIQDSGVEAFKEKLNYYLMHERKPQLFKALAKALQPICKELKDYYLDLRDELESKPVDVETIKHEELTKLGLELHRISLDFSEHIHEQLNEAFATNNNNRLERDYRQLQKNMLNELDHLIANFSVEETHQLARRSHEENVVVPVMAILSEAFYYVTNGLKKVLTASSQQLVNNFFNQLTHNVSSAEYYKRLQDLLGNDAGINQTLDKDLRQEVIHAITNEARTECEPYIRETALFYAEGTVPAFQLRQTLYEACQSTDFQGMLTAEPAVRQLLEIDFRKKVHHTIMHRFRTTIDETINHHLLLGVDEQVKAIIAQFHHAHALLEHNIEKDAERQIKAIQQQKKAVEANIGTYNQAVDSVNQDLQVNGCTGLTLPKI
ncbi:dynamin family protein [Limnoraphis robusta]|uniref:Dynamin family protein n=1 Tax=Limnoraphis robusta CCNP1315 TaxID=3110306 RepID=A0ABU5U7D8_9CYAN|nr:dynamin family protein [Limnoraphis robusta]MEA5523121.1 dynamin family protein [Limnoraphis robusta CCNP1315]MEA5545362.1 dynamin family protein [Limnoraphis robusta CCNP1324]